MAAWFSGLVGFLMDFFGFFKWSKLFDFVLSGLKFSSMLAVNTIIMGFMVAYFAALLYSLKFIYEKINYIISYIQNFPNSNDVSSLALSVIKSIGAWNGFVDAVNIFIPIIASIIAIYGGKLGIIIFKNSREVLLSLFISKL
jgi:hypothetical protein